MGTQTKPRMHWPPLRRQNSLARGLKLHIPGWEGSGSQSQDIVGPQSGSNSKHGTLDGATWEADENGLVLDFQASNSALVSGAIKGPTGYPITTVVRGKTGASGTSRFFNWGNVAADTTYIALDVNVGVDWSYFIRDLGSVNGVFFTGTPLANTWYTMVAVSASAIDHKFYIDGVLADTSTVSAAFPSTINGFGLGALVRATPILSDCRVDYASIYDRAISAAEAERLHNKPYELITPGQQVFAPVAVGNPWYQYAQQQAIAS